MSTNSLISTPPNFSSTQLSSPTPTLAILSTTSSFSSKILSQISATFQHAPTDIPIQTIVKSLSSNTAGINTKYSSLIILSDTTKTLSQITSIDSRINVSPTIVATKEETTVLTIMIIVFTVIILLLILSALLVTALIVYQRIKKRKESIVLSHENICHDNLSYSTNVPIKASANLSLNNPIYEGKKIILKCPHAHIYIYPFLFP